MLKKAWTIATVNMKNIHAAYIVTAIGFVYIVFVHYVLAVIAVAKGMDILPNTILSAAWTLWLLIPLAAILVPTRNFNRTINLGAKRNSVFIGSLMFNVVVAGAVSLVSILISYVGDKAIDKVGSLGHVLVIQDVFGWGTHGPVVAFLQQFAFLFLAITFIHTLSAAHRKWYGLVADVVIIAIIVVFNTKTTLRADLTRFFHTILFGSAPWQIPTCLILGAVIYAVNKPLLTAKAI
ncbi:MAG: hypothetical protein FWF43_01510 [Propionibacteriaceae bacterium]|nr:hypothetical protein [Propionibacteriaceae bacterium]